MKKVVSLVLTAAMALSLVACNNSSDSSSSSGKETGEVQILTMGTGDTGGSLYPAGSAIASVVNDTVAGVKMNIQTSSGSADNARSTAEGSIDLSLCTADVAYQAVTSTGQFEGQNCTDLLALFPIYSSIFQAMALDSSGIEYVEDLVGERVSVGMAASAAELISNVVFTEMGETYPDCIEAQYLGVAEGCDAVKDGTAAAHISFGGYPQGGMLDLSTTMDSHLLKFSDELLEKILTDYNYYFKTEVPANVYTNQTDPIVTFGVKCLCITNSNMSEEMAYNICKAVWENIEDIVAANSAMSEMLDPEYIAGDLAIDFHPGAIKYFTEIGLM